MSLKATYTEKNDQLDHARKLNLRKKRFTVKKAEGNQSSRGHKFYPPLLRLYRRGKATVPTVKSRSRMTNADQSEPGTYANKTDRYSRRFGRRFFSGSSRRLHAIFFIYKGSDRRLRTSPSRGYCWGLDLRERAQRFISD